MEDKNSSDDTSLEVDYEMVALYRKKMLENNVKWLEKLAHDEMVESKMYKNFRGERKVFLNKYKCKKIGTIDDDIEFLLGSKKKK